MGSSAVLIANRGEIAIRVSRAAAELGVRTVAVHSADDADALHIRKADEVHPLAGTGPAAYLDAEQLVAIAKRTGCWGIHPGYGFLSESPEFADRCAREGLVFVGPDPAVLRMFGDKSCARQRATELGIPVLEATSGPTSVRAGVEFLDSLGSGGAVMVKALAGGGGRGMRLARTATELADAFERCGSEARQAFGASDLYVERYLPHAHHVEVQVVGDGTGAVTHLWERDCSIQRQQQKLVEIAPSPRLPGKLRDRITEAAVRLAADAKYRGAGTVEFLVDTTDGATDFHFIEINPRLQVEHTVTEEITGVDLVSTQLRLAAGESLAEARLGQHEVSAPDGYALQARVNLETLDAAGNPRPSAGKLTTFEPPAGPGVRVDSHGYAGYAPGARFDSLLAKVVAHAPRGDFAAAVSRARRAIGEFAVRGPATNLPLLRAILHHPEFSAGRFDTGFLERYREDLRAAADEDRDVPADYQDPARAAGVAEEPEEDADPDGTEPVRASMPATVVKVPAQPGDRVRRGDPLAVLEAMKMEHVITAPTSGTLGRVRVAGGEVVDEGTPLVDVLGDGAEEVARGGTTGPDPDAVPEQLDDVLRRHASGLDEARPEAVRRRRTTGQRTARENIDDLCDPETFVEYGPLALAAQRRRRSAEELAEKTPADGMVTGIGHVNGEHLPAEASRCVVMSYDYTVLAGTQGLVNHRKTDRMLGIAERSRLPVVLFAEGGGGRPGDTDTTSVSGLDVGSFHAFGRLSGLVPLIGIVSGRCFAGNAALLGCCDVVIATRDASVGMAGPAMIEGGGLGTFRPEEVGPTSMQQPNGVIDVLVEDEAEAVAVARRYLSYFQSAGARAPDPTAEYDSADQRLLRHVVPQNRRRVYDVRGAIETLADTGSVLELRRGFGIGAVTALVRVAGRPMGLIANNPDHLGGAIDRDAADKLARFLQLCEAFALPVVSLCDTPGFMVGPETERTATVRHFSRLFVTGANLTVPLCAVVLRKAYGLGAQAMAGGSFQAPVATVSWPSGEVGAMGLEGAVHLGYRRELEAISDPEQRQVEFERLVQQAYEHGKALNAASVFELDDVIDPTDTRRWITETLTGSTTGWREVGKRVGFVDTW